MSKHKTAIIGCGRIANTHARGYSRHPDIDMVAGVDINAEGLTQFRETWNIPQGFNDHLQMLEQVKPELVSICTYADLHWPMLKACVDAGVKGIICEKPMLNSPSELPKLRALVQESGVKIAIGHMRRYGMAHVRARDLIQAGEIGDPVFVIGQLSGGGLAEMGSHWIDLLRYLLNDADVQTVLAQTNMHDSIVCGHPQEDDATLRMTFDGDVEGVFISGQKQLKGDVLTIINGTQGSIQIIGEDDLIVASPSGVRTEVLKDDQPQEWHSYGLELPEPWWEYKWDGLMRDYVNWVEGGEEPGIGFENAIKATEIYLAGYLSAIERRIVELPLNGDELTLDQWPGHLLKEEAAKR